ncbi:hypothetical protein WA026_015290 [Henosepilachna vigintioctopunctata]|uniref:Fatty acyl-CoA reductase n=1 Tax=Henosepilachna vigintioctopunctata TaxID=420089 RepID=A0AAW1TTV1_9CUCU
MEGVYATREGGDIFATDMVHVETESKIAAMFENATILLTGGTGYIGKMFLEKLLRSCPKLRMVYLLLRPKKGKDVEKRFQEIFDGPNMVPLKLANQKYLDKVSIINGDCVSPYLGLDDQDKQKIINETTFVIHCAATVRFDEKLKQAAYINVRAVKHLIEIAKQMKNLKGFLHVSTAFSHCALKSIDEQFYKPGLSGDHLLDLVEMLDEERLEKITPGLLGKWPNSYVFTKAIAEDVIKNEAKNLPIAVIRPSIVIASLNEPVAGWIDNYYGATGVFIGAALGLLRSLHGDKKNLAEMIPADYVTNAGIAVLWEIASNRELNTNDESKTIEGSNSEDEDVPIYNIVSSPEAPITWNDFTTYAEKHTPEVPSELQVWKYFFALRPNRLHHLLAVFLLHTIPAYIVDFVCLCIGKKPMMVKGYKKINKFMDVIGHFSLREWHFTNHNLQKLWKKMDVEDKTLFNFSMENFDWDNYFYFYARGARVYLLKDPLDTIPKGRIKYWKLFIAHYTLVAVLLFLLYKFIYLLISLLF